MSDYIKHVFNDGDILTAEQLNAMNNQIELDANQVDTINNQLSTITGQLDGKASLTGATFTGDVDVVGNITISDATKELNVKGIINAFGLKASAIDGYSDSFKISSSDNGIIQTGNLIVGTSSDPTTAIAYFSNDFKLLNGLVHIGAMGAYLNGTDVSYMPNGIKTRLFLTSPNGTLFEIKVSDNGEISATQA